MKEVKLKCKKCSYLWIPRKKPGEIRECPNCKTRDWKEDEKKG